MNIALIGMMGCGKSTISKQLSLKLSDYSLVDMDSLIVEKEGMSINNIFSMKGEDYFRQVESILLKEILTNDNQIISTGGGIVKSSENLSLLKRYSKVFYLKADAETLYNRVKKNSERPLLNGANMYQLILKFLNERAHLYEQADFSIDTVNRSPEQIVENIIEKLS